MRHAYHLEEQVKQGRSPVDQYLLSVTVMQQLLHLHRAGLFLLGYSRITAPASAFCFGSDNLKFLCVPRSSKAAYKKSILSLKTVLKLIFPLPLGLLRNELAEHTERASSSRVSADQNSEYNCYFSLPLRD
jgi:hypothetical protein